MKIFENFLRLLHFLQEMNHEHNYDYYQNQPNPRDEPDAGTIWNVRYGGWHDASGIFENVVNMNFERDWTHAYPNKIEQVHLQELTSLGRTTFRECDNLKHVTIVSDQNHGLRHDLDPTETSWRDHFPPLLDPACGFKLCLIDHGLEDYLNEGPWYGLFDLEHFADLVTEAVVSTRWYWLPKLYSSRNAPRYPRLSSLHLRGINLENSLDLFQRMPNLKELILEDVCIPAKGRAELFQYLQQQNIKVTFIVNSDFAERHQKKCRGNRSVRGYVLGFEDITAETIHDLEIMDVVHEVMKREIHSRRFREVYYLMYVLRQVWEWFDEPY
jgi:hypothetical protein